MHSGIHRRNVVRSIAELESFLSIPNSSIFGLLWGGWPGIGGGFDFTSLPVVGTFDHSLSSFDQQ